MRQPHVLLKIEQTLDELRPAWFAAQRDSNDCDYEELLSTLSTSEALCQSAITLAVRYARAAKWTWADIAKALHIHESTARQRYKDLPPMEEPKQATYKDS